jgi:hypothetical protein
MLYTYIFNNIALTMQRLRNRIYIYSSITSSPIFLLLLLFAFIYIYIHAFIDIAYYLGSIG